MASQKIVEAKATVVDEITEVAKNNASFILFDYRGLTAEETSELRKILRESDSKYKVWKNTLTKRALNDLNIDLHTHFEGPSAISFSTDALAPVKVLSDFAKKHEALELKVGLIDGKITDTTELGKLATIPDRQTLLTMLACGLMGKVKDLSICLDLYSKKLEEK